MLGLWVWGGREAGIKRLSWEREARRAWTVRSTGHVDMGSGEKEGCSWCSVASRGMRLGDWIWQNREGRSVGSRPGSQHSLSLLRLPFLHLCNYAKDTASFQTLVLVHKQRVCFS